MGKAKKASIPEGPSSRYRFFCWAVAFLSLAQLMVGLDYITIWPGAEAQFIWDSQTIDSAFSPLLKLMGNIPLDSEFWLIAYRLPGLFLYLIGVFLFFVWGQALFGRQTVEITLLVTAATFLLPVLAKNGGLDSWRFGLEIACWIALLRYIKSPERSWLIRVALLGTLAVLVGQWATLIMLVIWQVGYYRILSGYDENLKRQLPKPFVIIFGIYALSFLASLLIGGATAHRAYFTFDFLSLGHLKFFFISLLSLAPFIGFTIAALRDLSYKFRRGEELAVLTVIGLFGSLLSLSLVFPFLLIFLTAKQVELYFKDKNYPWQDWAKAGQVLHLVLVFLAVVIALLGGFFRFQTDGFRAVLGCSAAYWMFSFVGVIGLYGFRRDYVLGGMTLAGLLALLFFWIQVYPFAHLQRNWPERLTTNIQKLEAAPDKVFLPKDEETTLPAGPYLLRNQIAVEVSDSITSNQFQIRLTEPADSSLQTDIKVSGWPRLWKTKTWVGN